MAAPFIEKSSKACTPNATDSGALTNGAPLLTGASTVDTAIAYTRVPTPQSTRQHASATTDLPGQTTRHDTR